MPHVSNQTWIYVAADGVPEVLRLLADAILEYKRPADHWLHEFDDGVVTITSDENEGVYIAGCCVSYSKGDV